MLFDYMQYECQQQLKPMVIGNTFNYINTELSRHYPSDKLFNFGLKWAVAENDGYSYMEADEVGAYNGGDGILIHILHMAPKSIREYYFDIYLDLTDDYKGDYENVKEYGKYSKEKMFPKLYSIILKDWESGKIKLKSPRTFSGVNKEK